MCVAALRCLLLHPRAVGVMDGTLLADDLFACAGCAVLVCWAVWLQSKRVRAKKKSVQQRFEEEWGELAAEASLFKKFKKGKVGGSV